MRALVVVMLAASVAHADGKTVLRIATIAPDGTGWAREVRALARDIDERTQGRVTMKAYFGAIAGDELEVGDRIERGQLDGSLSGGALCQKLSPSMRVSAIQGLFQSREEASFVMTALNKIFDVEFHDAGYTNLGTAGVGSAILFANAPVKSLQDLRQLRVARWHLDEVGLRMDHALGLKAKPLPPQDVVGALQARELDGVITAPSVVLAWQMISHVKYFLDLRMSYFYGCTIVASRAFDRLSVEDQASLRAAVAKFRVRMEETGRSNDDALLGGLLQQRGIVSLPVTPELRSEFLGAARHARELLGDRLGVPTATVHRALELLADYRAEHPR